MAVAPLLGIIAKPTKLSIVNAARLALSRAARPTF